jgi:tRNA pseudouridine55 synthase
MSEFDFKEGEVLLIDKPLTWTSFDVVRKIRNRIRIKKVGHAGTLDPLATGLLVVCTGKKTKTINDIQVTDKEYTGAITLGASRPSYDRETEVDATFDLSEISEALIRENVSSFLGTIEQVPPIHSAIKVDGERVYKKARRGEDIKLKPRQVTIHEFEILKINLPHVYFRISCTKGTYIRSIAHDFGKALGVGGYLEELRRTKIGNLSVENAMSIDDFMKVTEQND